MKCYICDDYCEDAVQIKCCFENFCDKHIKEEIMKNFTCPNCKQAVTMKDIVPNKKLRESIKWFKALLSESMVMGPGGKPIGGGFVPSGSNIGNLPNVGNVPKNVPSNVPVITTEEKTHPVLPQSQTQSLNQVTTLDKIEETNEGDMTTEEKMQLYNKLNEEKADSVRKPSEDKLEKSLKSAKSGDLEAKSVKSTSSMGRVKDTTSVSHPTQQEKPAQMPHPQMPFQPGQMGPMGSMPMPYGVNPYYPRMYYPMMPMGYPYGGAPGMYPIGMAPPSEDKSKSKQSEKSESSERSKSTDRHKRKKRSRSRSRSRSSRSKERRSRKHRDHRDKERHKEKDRSERDRNKDRSEKDRHERSDRERKDRSYKDKKYK